jgi:hypothetical protein
VISERADIDLAEASARLRFYARNTNRRLTDVAQATVNGSLDPRAWAPPPVTGSAGGGGAGGRPPHLRRPG